MHRDPFHKLSPPIWHLSCLYQFMRIDGIDDMDDREWRRLCQLAAQEQDSQRLSEIVDDLIRALDARRQALQNSEQERKSVPRPARVDN